MITGQQTKAVYLANGTQTEFPLPFFFFDQGDVVVSTVDQYGVEAQITTGYAVAGAQDEDGGTVTFAAPPTAGLKLVLRRRTARKQETRYPEGGKFPSRTVETDFDKLVAIAQELTEEVARCVQTPADDSIDRNELVQELLAARGAAAVSAEEAATSAAAAQGQANRAESEADAAAAARVAAESVADGVARVVADAREEVVASAAFVPIGAILDFPVNTVPAGFLICAGQVVTREAYPDLVTYLTGGTVALAATIPDLRGEFRRGADLGRGVDAGRVVGSAQGDAFQGHRHFSNGSNDVQAGASSSRLYSLAYPAGDQQAVGDPTTDTRNGAPRTASETRPRNVAVVSCIKAYHAPMSAAPVDLTAALGRLDALAAVFSPNVGKFCTVYPTATNVSQSFPANVETIMSANGGMTTIGESWPSAGDGSMSIVIPEDGVYEVRATAKLYSGAVGAFVWGTILADGSGLVESVTYSQMQMHTSLKLLATRQLAAGTVLRVRIYPSALASGGGGNVNNLTVTRVR